MTFPPRMVQGGLAASWLGRLALRPGLCCRDHARPQHQIFVLDAFIPIAHLNCSILPLTDQCLALCRSVPPVLPLAHASELRRGRLSLLSLSFRWLPLIDVLPIRVQRPGNSMLLNPRSQYPRRCPHRLLFTHPAVRISRGVIHHVHQATSRPSFFKPGMETSIQLHQVTKVLPPRSPLPVCFPSPHAAPQPLR